MLGVSLINAGSRDLIHLDAMRVRVLTAAMLSAYRVLWSWSEDLGMHSKDKKYLGNWCFL